MIRPAPPDAARPGGDVASASGSPGSHPSSQAKPLVMGILNVTPDSFSDGGQYFDHEQAVRHGLAMVDEGADVVDVGGESSRPGAIPVPEEEECRRVVPVVAALAGRVRLSIDTVKPKVAEAAIAAGATLVNDVSGTLWPMAAEAGVGWVAMHIQGTPTTMQRAPHYDDVVGEVRARLRSLVERAREAGVAEIWSDPGIGFGKTKAHNLSLLRHLGDVVADGVPVLVGTSRKGFLARIAPRAGGEASPVAERLPASLATAAWAMLSGAGMVRVHDVASTVQAAGLIGGQRLQPAGAPSRGGGGWS